MTVTDPFADLPKNYFGAILVDPPWPFATWSHKGQGRSGEAEKTKFDQQEKRETWNEMWAKPFHRPELLGDQ
jgi:hypothetical protein